MSDVTVKQFAEVVGVPPDRLLVQLGEAGLSVNDENATISDNEKTQLLDFLRQSHGNRGAVPAAGGNKITLKRKTQTELRAKVPAGRGPAGRGAERVRPEARTVTVEVRKKRTYVKRADLMAEEQQRLDEEAAEQARIKAAADAVDEAANKKREEARKKVAEEKAAEDLRLQTEREAREKAAEEKRQQALAAEDNQGRRANRAGSVCIFDMVAPGS